MTVRVFAPAKVNLTLHVTGQRADGYHMIDSLVAFSPVGDLITICDNEVTSLTVDGPEAAGVPVDKGNLALQAADIVAPGRHVSILLEKHLPVSSGIGGGSADAAAVVRGLVLDWSEEVGVRETFSLNVENFEAKFGPLIEPLMSLGADIPMCLLPRPQRVRGIGGKSKPIEIPLLPALLVNPRVSVSTQSVFTALEQKNNPPMDDDIPDFSGPVDFCEWLATQRNDLETPAMRICPEIAQVLQALRNLKGALLARMSGSGATCFVVFETPAEAQAAGQRMQDDHPNWWIAGGLLGDWTEKSTPEIS